MSLVMPDDPATDIEVAKRRYDKGDRRFRHVGTSPVAIIEYENGNPKKAIGKCPNDVPDSIKEQILGKAVVASNGDREIDYPAKLYAVYRGVIYEARTTTRGYSYHAFPYEGRLASSILDVLQARAVADSSEDEFKRWVKAHITVHGNSE